MVPCVVRTGYRRTMTKRKAGPKSRKRGRIETLPSGALRVSVYAGIDPLTKLRHYLKETIPADHPELWDEAERVLTRLLNEVDEKRNPQTNATVNQLMDEYLAKIDVDTSTRIGYERCIRNHIRPLLGTEKVASLDGELLDNFYTRLRNCRRHCPRPRKFIEHRKKGDHECTDKCKPHKCKGLSSSSIRQIHSCLSGALARALRWKWIKVNPIDQAEPPKSPTANPHPPKPEQAARIVNEAFKDLAWGMLVWLTMTTGARRGEMCALRWDLLDLDTAVLEINTSIGQEGERTWEKDTKTHQQRRIALDETTVALLRAYRLHCEEKAKEMGLRIAPEGRIFSRSVDHSTWLKPDTVSQHYSRMCEGLKIETNLHALRHYSATELIASGVDARTLAGRLGHSGGGATTLRVYSAWVSEADQRAAGDLGGRMPSAPISVNLDGTTTTTLEPEIRGPYQQIAADLRGAILFGAFKAGDTIPTVAELRDRYGVSTGTAHRAIAELSSAGLIEVSRGKRAVVAPVEKSTFANVVSLKAKRAN